jgi:hypothetical protein
VKRTPLTRKTPLRAKAALTVRTRLKPKRETPRVTHPERVQQERIKPRSTGKTAMEKFHLARIAAMPCCICRKAGPSTVHHVRRRADRKGLHKRDHMRVVPLCPAHHLHDHGPDSVEKLKESGFLAKFKIDLWITGEKLWAQTCGLYAVKEDK